MTDKNIVVKLENVTKQYRGYKALNHCSLQLSSGKIYGLVGKNGAGKTTLMRMIAGLVLPDEGKIQVQKPQNGRIGMLIESPGLNPGMTAKEQLRFCRMLAGLPKCRKEDEALLDQSGLSGAGHKKIRDYSLGMRQRLGIAAAVLGMPGFVMLDEPVNGLDPIGVVEMRSYIRGLCAVSGMTVLISSHNLPELYQTATDYIIIDQGAVKKQITHEALRQESCENLEEYFLSVIGDKESSAGTGGANHA